MSINKTTYLTRTTGEHEPWVSRKSTFTLFKFTASSDFPEKGSGLLFWMTVSSTLTRISSRIM